MENVSHNTSYSEGGSPNVHNVDEEMMTSKDYSS